MCGFELRQTSLGGGFSVRHIGFSILVPAKGLDLRVKTVKGRHTAARRIKWSDESRRRSVSRPEYPNVTPDSLLRLFVNPCHTQILHDTCTISSDMV